MSEGMIPDELRREAGRFERLGTNPDTFFDEEREYIQAQIDRINQEYDERIEAAENMARDIKPGKDGPEVAVEARKKNELELWETSLSEIDKMRTGMKEGNSESTLKYLQTELELAVAKREVLEGKIDQVRGSQDEEKKERARKLRPERKQLDIRIKRLQRFKEDIINNNLRNN